MFLANPNPSEKQNSFLTVRSYSSQERDRGSAVVRESTDLFPVLELYDRTVSKGLVSR